MIRWSATYGGGPPIRGGGPLQVAVVRLRWRWSAMSPPTPGTVKAVLGILNTDLAGGLGDLSIALVLPLLSLVLPASCWVATT